MTRINAGIPPADLHDKHLLAEHREIKRIPNQISRGKYRLENIPEQFKLGAGHVKFFYDKCGYLLNRYIDLREECRKRGFNVQDWAEAWSGVPKSLMNDWLPDDCDREIVWSRILERWPDSDPPVERSWSEYQLKKLNKNE
jgi:deoxyribonuclease (pyrimidine dimer)